MYSPPKWTPQELKERRLRWLKQDPRNCPLTVLEEMISALQEELNHLELKAKASEQEAQDLRLRVKQLEVENLSLRFPKKKRSAKPK